MKTLFKLLKWMLAGFVTLYSGIIGIALLFFIMFNGAGFLVGFDSYSLVCNNVRNNSRTNFEYYMFPIAKYACKEDGGLLQPHASNILKWLDEKQNEEEDKYE